MSEAGSANAASRHNIHGSAAPRANAIAWLFMASESQRARSSDHLQIEQDGNKRPFMRGILVHSLMARGLTFEEAYEVANAVRDKLRGQGTVAKTELANAVNQFMEKRGLSTDTRTARAPMIQVRGRQTANPFSKGFLSQSLLAAAIDPKDAFDTAGEIEATLSVRGVREIDRRDLRRLTFEVLERRFGARSAERYLVWRRFQQPKRPVILLLGGVTGAGKTSLAVEVAHRLGIHRVLSTDSIRQVMRIMLSQELVPAIHASSYDAYLELAETGPGEDAVLSGFETQAATVLVGVRAMLDRAIEENASLILDGVSIVPGMLDLEAYRGKAHIVFLLVATFDADAIRERFEARGQDSKRPPHRYLQHLEAILRIQDHLLELADRYDVPIVDNDVLDASVLSIIKHMTGTLRKADEFNADEML